MLSEYSGKSIKDVDKGAVLVCFKEPALRKGAKVLRRKPTSASHTNHRWTAAALRAIQSGSSACYNSVTPAR